MKRAAPRRIAWSIVVASAGLATTGVLLGALGGAGTGVGDDISEALGIVVALAVLLVGGLVASRQPRNPIGWILCGFSAFNALTALAAGYAIILVGVLGVPVAIGIALLRYRLYEIDRIISRTIVYGALSIVLAAVYAGVVLAGEAVFSSFAGGSSLAIAVSTLAAAALFLPARSRIQRAVDRRFYRRRYDAQRTLEAFGARLREQVDLDALGAELCGVVSQTVQPSHVAVWLRRERRG